jgi:hypothetical protein
VSLGLGKEFAHKSWNNNNEWTRNNHNTSNMPKHKRKYKKRAKRNGDSTSTNTFACPNGLCGQVFASKQGVSNHYLHYSQCYKVSTGSAAFWQQREEETNVAHAAPFTQPDSDSEDDATQFDFDYALQGYNRLVSEFVWPSARVGCPPFPRMAIACLENTHRGYFSGADPNEVHTLNLVLFTEYKRNGQLFRAHPVYCGPPPWHDWAMF